MERRSKRLTKAEKEARRRRRKGRGAKRCPACNCNTFSNGGCPCGFGHRMTNIEILDGINDIAISANRLAYSMIAKQIDQERDKYKELGTTEGKE